MPDIEYPKSPNTPVSHLPFSPAVRFGDLIFVSGQASVDKTGKIISVVDHGPRPGDDAYLDVIADIIADRIIKEAQHDLRKQ